MTPNTTMVPAMKLALEASFGSGERWRTALAAGAAWLAFCPRAGALVLRRGAAADVVPLLALQAGAELDAIDWAPVYQRYQQAVHDASEAYAATPEDLAAARLFDVRRAAIYEQAATRLPGAAWRDPAGVSDWARELPAGEPVVVYCIYGHEVGRSTALRLRAQGIDARFLAGGIDAWASSGRPVEPKGAAS